MVYQFVKSSVFHASTSVNLVPLWDTERKTVYEEERNGEERGRGGERERERRRKEERRHRRRKRKIEKEGRRGKREGGSYFLK